MSCSMTIPAVRDRTKTVTRRREDTWTTLKVGDRLTLIEKGMGLPKGAKQVVIGEVEVVDVRVEPIGKIIDEGFAGTAAEGLPDLVPIEFAIFWAKGHGYIPRLRPPLGEVLMLQCRRIEWRYLDE